MSKAFELKPKSYYDWNQQFIHSYPEEIVQENKKYEAKKVNSLGISEDNFADFLKEWKKKNNL